MPLVFLRASCPAAALGVPPARLHTFLAPPIFPSGLSSPCHDAPRPSALCPRNTSTPASKNPQRRPWFRLPDTLLSPGDPHAYPPSPLAYKEPVVPSMSRFCRHQTPPTPAINSSSSTPWRSRFRTSSARAKPLNQFPTTPRSFPSHSPFTTLAVPSPEASSTSPEFLLPPCPLLRPSPTLSEGTNR